MASIVTVNPTTGNRIHLPVCETYLLPRGDGGFLQVCRVSIEELPSDWPMYDRAVSEGASHYDFVPDEILQFNE